MEPHAKYRSASTWVLNYLLMMTRRFCCDAAATWLHAKDRKDELAEHHAVERGEAILVPPLPNA